MPIHPLDYHLLGFTWNDRYYFDSVLPMGCSVSCKLFEELSQSIQWIVTTSFNVGHMSHILDDFIFFADTVHECNRALQTFFCVANSVNLPIKEQKTVHPTTTAFLHGIEVDTCRMELRLPDDKKNQAVSLLKDMSRRKKVRLRQLQSLIGTLAFACRAVAPGRTFLRRLINLTCGAHPSHVVRLNSEARKDINIWLVFLSSFNGTSILLPTKFVSSDTVKLYSDASNAGFAAVYGCHWLQDRFPPEWHPLHITVKELLPIVLAVQKWGSFLANKRLLFFCDNMGVVAIINSQTSKDNKLMSLVRKLVLMCLQFNIFIRAKPIPGKYNFLSDCLSRFQVDKARQAAPWLDPHAQPIHHEWHTWCL